MTMLKMIDGGSRSVSAEDLHTGDVICWEGKDHVLIHVERVSANRVRVFFESGDFVDWQPELKVICLASIDMPRHFEMGGCYEHASGEIMRVVGSAHTKRFGPCLVSERPGVFNLVPVNTAHEDSKAWKPIPVSDFLVQWEADVRTFEGG
jgi:hypothetical protein